MALISQLVDIKTGYANYVNLVDEFGDPDRNRGRMEGYMPISAHREAFERLAHLGLPMDNRVYLLLGTYGTGKSHLLLMLANYLSRAKQEVEMKLLLDNWAHQDADQAQKLAMWRGDGRYLVALADFGKGGTFESMVLRAIEAACARDGFDGYMQTHYGEAARQLGHWREQERKGGPSGAYRDFQSALQQLSPGVTLAGLELGLESFDAEALDQFQRAYRQAVGSEFHATADNLVDILQAFMGSQSFHARYRGVVVLADEFGYVLDRGALNISGFHRFAEMCKTGVGGASLSFVGTGHRVSLQAYAGSGYSEADIGVLADRIAAVPLRSEGIEEIISAIVVPRRESELWKQTVATQTSALNKLAMACTPLDLFSQIKGPERRNKIIESIYPMHPMATHCAIELSQVVGSAARSLFTFFAGKPTVTEESSYPWFVANTEIVTDGRLNLYTADLLAAYFHNELQPENLETRQVVRDEVRNYQASQRLVEELMSAQSLVRDEFVFRVLRIVLVYRVVGVAPTRDALLFGLDMTTRTEEARLDNTLKSLVSSQALFLNPTTKAYEFRIAGAGRDIKQYLDAFLNDASLHPKDLAQAVTDTSKLPSGDLWLNAEAHNQPYMEDKRLLRVFALPADVERKDYFTKLEEAMRSERDWRKRYEGVAVYVLCESQSDIDRAHRVAGRNQSSCIILGIPEEPIGIRQPLLNLLAALHVQSKENLDEWSQQERTRLVQDYVGNRSQGFTSAFLKTRERYLQGEELRWIGTMGHPIVNRPGTPHEPASILMSQLYVERNTHSHFNLNQIHVAIGSNTNAPLFDAVNSLIRTNSPLIVDTALAQNTGDMRYLSNALAHCDVLAQIGAANGSKITYRVQLDTQRFAKAFPALAHLLARLRAMKVGDQVRLAALVKEYAEPPFGQGPYALSLFVAVAIRALGDSLQLKHSPEEWGIVMLTDASEVFDLIDGKHPNAVLAYREITLGERTFVNGLFRLFSEDPGEAGQDHSVSDAYGTLKQWWDKQTRLARVPTLYSEQGELETARFVNKMMQIASYTPYEFVLRELQTICEMDPNDAITQENQAGLLRAFHACQDTMRLRPTEFKLDLLKELVIPFEPKSDVYGDYQEAIETWYKGLQEYQRDPHGFPLAQQQASAMLASLPKISSIEETVWRDLPSNPGFGLGAVDDWTFDRSQEYRQKFEAGLRAIAERRPPVPDPEWEVAGDDIGCKRGPTQSAVTYRDRVRLDVRVPHHVSQVFITSNGEDPTRDTAQRECVLDTWDKVINNSPNLKLVSRAADGDWGRVIEISFTNLDFRYKVRPALQSRIGENEYTFTLPSDIDGARMTLTSLVEAAIQKSGVSKLELAKILRELAERLSS